LIWYCFVHDNLSEVPYSIKIWPVFVFNCRAHLNVENGHSMTQLIVLDVLDRNFVGFDLEHNLALPLSGNITLMLCTLYLLAKLNRCIVTLVPPSHGASFGWKV